MYTGNAHFLFFRLHGLLCERLTIIRDKSVDILAENQHCDNSELSETPAAQLGMRNLLGQLLSKSSSLIWNQRCDPRRVLPCLHWVGKVLQWWECWVPGVWRHAAWNVHYESVRCLHNGQGTTVTCKANLRHYPKRCVNKHTSLLCSRSCPVSRWVLKLLAFYSERTNLEFWYYRWVGIKDAHDNTGWAKLSEENRRKINRRRIPFPYYCCEDKTSLRTGYWAV